MEFTRQWDASCPRTYDHWEADGVCWVIQDLPPEDDETAVQMLLEHLVPDEIMCKLSGLKDDPISMAAIADFWRHSLKQRMTLACYAETAGQRSLVAANCCVVQCDREKGHIEVKGKAWKNVHGVLEVIDEKWNAFKCLGLDKLLYGLGLVVKREYRGAGLGAKVLAAREPLALSQGIKGTSTIFTGPASQKSAERAGFETVYEITLRELSDAGLKFPRDDRVFKLMVKKYED